MSLQTDIIFVKALRSDSGLMAALASGDVYNTAIPLPEQDALNAALPYVIVSFDGMENTESTKDNRWEGATDRVQIGIEIAARERPQVADIAISCRNAVAAYFAEHVQDTQDEDYPLIPSQYDLQAEGVRYDERKPCYWQRLTFTCDTDKD